MFKKMMIFMLIFFSINVFANKTTIYASQTSHDEIKPWVIDTRDGGYLQLLGPGGRLKKFSVYVAPLHNGKTSDAITVWCNAGDGNYLEHFVSAGERIVCYPHFKDVISIEIDKFQNGAAGDFIFHFEDSSETK